MKVELRISEIEDRTSLLIDGESYSIKDGCKFITEEILPIEPTFVEVGERDRETEFEVHVGTLLISCPAYQNNPRDFIKKFQIYVSDISRLAIQLRNEIIYYLVEI